MTGTVTMFEVLKMLVFFIFNIAFVRKRLSGICIIGALPCEV